MRYVDCLCLIVGNAVLTMLGLIFSLWLFGEVVDEALRKVKTYGAVLEYFWNRKAFNRWLDEQDTKDGK